MNICIVAPYNALALVSGAPIRTFRLAEGLNICGASVFVLHTGPSLTLNSRFVFFHFESLSPLESGANYLQPINPLYLANLSRLLRKKNPDVVQAEQPWIAFPTFMITKKHQIPLVLDEHNVELEWQMHSSRIQFLAPYTFLVEKLAVSKSLFTLTVSGTDKENLSRLYKTPKEKFFIIPNGVDSSRFSNLSPSPILRSKLGFSPDDKIVFFHGSLDVKPNYEAAKTIIQDIAPKIKGAKFLIAGSKPPAWLRAKSERSKNITLIGYVRQVEHYIKAADVCIAPLKTGSGTRLKIIEYASSAKPIVATYKATEGLPFVNNVSALLFENANEDFSEGIDRVLSDGTLAQRLSSNAKEISMKFDWKEISRVLYDKYMSLFRDNKDRPHKIVFES